MDCPEEHPPGGDSPSIAEISGGYGYDLPPSPATSVKSLLHEAPRQLALSSVLRTRSMDWDIGVIDAEGATDPTDSALLLQLEFATIECDGAAALVHAQHSLQAITRGRTRQSRERVSLSAVDDQLAHAARGSTNLVWLREGGLSSKCHALDKIGSLGGCHPAENHPPRC
jgi:hypothetical protein